MVWQILSFRGDHGDLRRLSHLQRSGRALHYAAEKAKGVICPIYL